MNDEEEKPMLDALAAKPVPSRHDDARPPGQVRLSHRSPARDGAVVLGGSLLFVAGPGCADEGIGNPCTPEQEYNPDFLGFDEKEVNVESKSFQCRTRLCLVNHFRGRVSCPVRTGRRAANGARRRARPRCSTFPGTSTTTDRRASATGSDDATSFVDHAQEVARPAAVHRSRRRQGRLLLVPLRRHQRPAPERPDLLRLPRRLPVRASRHLDRSGQRRPHRLVLHQGRTRSTIRRRRARRATATRTTRRASATERAAALEVCRRASAVVVEHRASVACSRFVRNFGARAGRRGESDVKRIARIGATPRSSPQRASSPTGFRILWRNVRIGPLEIDLVAKKDDLVDHRRGALARPERVRRPLASITWTEATMLLRAARGLWRGRSEEDARRSARAHRRHRDDAIADGPRVEWIEGAITGRRCSARSRSTRHPSKLPG